MGFILYYKVNIVYFAYPKDFSFVHDPRFPVGQRSSETRIGIIKIGEDVSTDDVLLLSEANDGTTVQLKISELQDGEIVTNTAAAIEKASEIFRTEGRDNRAYPHILVIATHSQSANPFQTRRQSAIAQLQGTIIVLEILNYKKRISVKPVQNGLILCPQIEKSGAFYFRSIPVCLHCVHKF